MIDDNLFSALQRGIEVTSTQNKAVVSTNTLSSNNITNTLTTLCYFGANTGTNSPRVTCNDLKNSFKAFEFNATNKGTYWRGNLMDTHAQGLTLSNSATISAQGSSGNPQDNQWIGSWTIGTNSGTYVDFSDAANSGIWYKSGSIPPTSNGNVGVLFQYGAPNTLSLTTGSYDCSGIGARMASQNSSIVESVILSNARATAALQDETQYLNETSLYRLIDAYPNTKDGNMIYNNFYNSKLNSSMDQFIQVEKALYNQQPTQAQNLNNVVGITNSVETNYQNFYTLHAKYQLGTFTDADSSALLQLANLCPGLDGEVVYQARALYNVNYKTVIRYVENCNPLTQNNLRILNKIVNKNANEWLIELFPNPANTFVNIVSTHEKDNLSVCIMDVSGKVLFVKEATTNNFICKLELDLLPGAYIVTITNDKNNTTNKKLIITK